MAISNPELGRRPKIHDQRMPGASCVGASGWQEVVELWIGGRATKAAMLRTQFHTADSAGIKMRQQPVAALWAGQGALFLRLATARRRDPPTN